jgi:hypothetical protein
VFTVNIPESAKMKKLIAFNIIITLFVMAAQAEQTCSVHVENKSVCSDGEMRITIEESVIGNSAFLLHAGDVGCWFLPSNFSGQLKSVGTNEFQLIATTIDGNSVLIRDIGQIQISGDRIRFSQNLVDRIDGLRSTTYDLDCK